MAKAEQMSVLISIIIGSDTGLHDMVKKAIAVLFMIIMDRSRFSIVTARLVKSFLLPSATCLIRSGEQVL